MIHPGKNSASLELAASSSSGPVRGAPSGLGRAPAGLVPLPWAPGRARERPGGLGALVGGEGCPRHEEAWKSNCRVQAKPIQLSGGEKKSVLARFPPRCPHSAKPLQRFPGGRSRPPPAPPHQTRHSLWGLCSVYFPVLLVVFTKPVFG